MRGLGCRSGARGFALVELLVAAAILLVVLALAADLLRESQVLLRNLAIEHQDPLPGLALLTLRRDLQLGASVDAAGGVVTIRQPAAAITYTIERGCLVRASWDTTTGDLTGERCLYPRTVAIALHPSLPGYAEVAVTLLQREPPRPHHAALGPRHLPELLPRSAVVAARLRADVPREGW